MQQQQQSRRPNLSSLEIPTRSIENSLSSFTRIDIPSPSSTRSGLPPRPNSTKFRSSVRNLLPQRSLIRGKNLTQDGEKTVLIMPDTPPSDKPTTSRSFSLNKVLFSTSTKSAHSLPVTPLANSGTDPVQERQSDHDSKSSVSVFCCYFFLFAYELTKCPRYFPLFDCFCISASHASLLVSSCKC